MHHWFLISAPNAPPSSLLSPLPPRKKKKSFQNLIKITKATIKAGDVKMLNMHWNLLIIFYCTKCIFFPDYVQYFSIIEVKEKKRSCKSLVVYTCLHDQILYWRKQVSVAIKYVNRPLFCCLFLITSLDIVADRFDQYMYWLLDSKTKATRWIAVLQSAPEEYYFDILFF